MPADREGEAQRGRRVPFLAPVELARDALTWSATAVNLAPRGIALKVRGAERGAARGLAPSTALDVALRLPSRRGLLRLRGVVVWNGGELADAQGRVTMSLGVRFTEEDSEALRLIAAHVDTFRYVLALLDWPEPEALARTIGKSFELVPARTERDIVERASAGEASLLMLGEGNDPAGGLARLERVLAATASAWPPAVLYLASEVTPALEALTRRYRRLACHAGPLSEGLQRVLVHRSIEGHETSLENERLTQELAAALVGLRRENEFYKTRLHQPMRLEGVIGDAPGMRRVYEMVERIAGLDTSVFVLGETGTGKGLVARAIHDLSARSKGPFVTQNCAAVSDTLVDSELFGHTRGSFTGALAERVGLFEAADGGTVFLDEIAEMSPSMQAKLLHVLQDGVVRRVGSLEPVRVNARVICASHQNLDHLVKQGRFRQDLYFRLVSFSIKLPALRERREDIGPLALHFMAGFAARHGLTPSPLSAQAVAVLETYPWPGNVRQLQHVVERLLILGVPGEEVSPARVHEAIHLAESSEAVAPPTSAASLEHELLAHERERIVKALERAGWVIADAARALGMNRSTLSKRLKRLAISPAGR